MGRHTDVCSTSPELVEELAKKWSDGVPSSEIGTFLGCSTASASTLISNLRRRYPKRFPRRRNKTLKRYSAMVRLLCAVQHERPDPRIAEVIAWMKQKAAKHPTSQET